MDDYTSATERVMEQIAREKEWLITERLIELGIAPPDYREKSQEEKKAIAQDLLEEGYSFIEQQFPPATRNMIVAGIPDGTFDEWTTVFVYLVRKKDERAEPLFFEQHKGLQVRFALYED